MAHDALMEAVEPVDRAVLRKLRSGFQHPIELIEVLSNEGYTTKHIKTTIAELLHDGTVELTTDQRLLSRADP